MAIGKKPPLTLSQGMCDHGIICINNISDDRIHSC